MYLNCDCLCSGIVAAAAAAAAGTHMWHYSFQFAQIEVLRHARKFTHLLAQYIFTPICLNMQEKTRTQNRGLSYNRSHKHHWVAHIFTAIFNTRICINTLRMQCCLPDQPNIHRSSTACTEWSVIGEFKGLWMNRWCITCDSKHVIVPFSLAISLAFSNSAMCSHSQ